MLDAGSPARPGACGVAGVTGHSCAVVFKPSPPGADLSRRSPTCHGVIRRTKPEGTGQALRAFHGRRPRGRKGFVARAARGCQVVRVSAPDDGPSRAAVGAESDLYAARSRQAERVQRRRRAESEWRASTNARIRTRTTRLIVLAASAASAGVSVLTPEKRPY